MDSPSLAFPRERAEVLTPSAGRFCTAYSRSTLWRKQGEDSRLHGYAIGSRSPGIGRSARHCATNVGVRLFAKAVAMECAAAGDEIRVNTVHPGIIDTPIWDEATGIGRDQGAD